MAHWGGHVGYVLQLSNLIPLLNVYENVELPLVLLRRPARDCRCQVAKALEAVGLESKARRYPTQLSGGEAKLPGIARAVVAEPDFVAADEPTAELDADTADRSGLPLARLNDVLHTTIVMVTDDPAVIERVPLPTAAGRRPTHRNNRLAPALDGLRFVGDSASSTE